MEPTPDAPLTPATRLVHTGRPAAVPGAGVNPAVELSTTMHAATDDNLMADPTVVNYARSGVPTWHALEETVGDLEGGQALVFASGIAAINAAVEAVLLVSSGDRSPARVVGPRHGYAGSLGLLRHLHETGRVDLVLVDPADTTALLAAVAGAALVWLETPANPTMEITDLAAVCAGARAAGATTVVDNTFATPLLQNPLALGADVVVHSVTKAMSGHSDVLMGALVATDDALLAAARAHRTRTGGVPGPFEAWLALRGLRTLDVRLERAQASAAVLAARLREHRAVSRVRYPGLAEDPGHALAARQMLGFGTILAVELPDARSAERLAAGTRLWVHATSLGGVESLIERRGRHGEPTTVPEGLLRLSVGIESVEDLWRDLAQALAGVGVG